MWEKVEEVHWLQLTSCPESNTDYRFVGERSYRNLSLWVTGPAVKF